MISTLRHHLTGPRILGLIVIILTILSLVYASLDIQRQRNALHCGGSVLQEVSEAIKVRDTALLDLTESDRKVIQIRFILLQILAEAPDAPPISRDQALRDYENTIRKYDAQIQVFTDALRNAPVPAGNCFSGY